MADADLRALERAAEAGDRQAARRLAARMLDLGRARPLPLECLDCGREHFTGASNVATDCPGCGEVMGVRSCNCPRCQVERPGPAGLGCPLCGSPVTCLAAEEHPRVATEDWLECLRCAWATGPRVPPDELDAALMAACAGCGRFGRPPQEPLGGVPCPTCGV